MTQQQTGWSVGGPAPTAHGGFPPPSFGWTSNGALPPNPPRRSPLRLVLAGLIGLLVVALGAFVAISLTSQPAQTAYANDDYQVPPPEASPPPIPVPRTYPQAVLWAEQNAVYEQKMPAPVRCVVPRENLGQASDAQLKAHFENLMECLVRAWYVPMQQAGFVIVRPTVTIYGEKMTTKCGDTGINAFYCGADQQVYYSRLITTRAPILADNPWAADVVIAHEFAHAIQGRSGILTGEYAQRNQAETKSAALLSNRRLETQADCFSGLFVRSTSLSLGVEDDDVPKILDAYYLFGADILKKTPNVESDHGLGATRRYWGQMGLANDAIARCNTFTADRSLVR